MSEEIDEIGTAENEQLNDNESQEPEVLLEPEPVKTKGKSKVAKPKKTEKPVKPTKAEKPAKPEKPAKTPKAEKTAPEPKSDGRKSAEKKGTGLGAPVAEPLLDEDEIARSVDLARTFKVLADSNRVAIVLALSKEEAHVGAIGATIDQSQPCVSHHLAIMRHCGVVEPRREGKNTYYSLSESGEQLSAIIAKL